MFGGLDDCHSPRATSGVLLAVLTWADRAGRRARCGSNHRRDALRPASRRAPGATWSGLRHLLLGSFLRARRKPRTARGSGRSGVECASSRAGERVTDLVALGFPFLAPARRA